MSVVNIQTGLPYTNGEFRKELNLRAQQLNGTERGGRIKGGLDQIVRSGKFPNIGDPQMRIYSRGMGERGVGGRMQTMGYSLDKCHGYVSKGLVWYLDAIDNTGNGYHDVSSTSWVNIVNKTKSATLYNGAFTNGNRLQVLPDLTGVMAELPENIPYRTIDVVMHINSTNYGILDTMRYPYGDSPYAIYYNNGSFQCQARSQDGGINTSPKRAFSSLGIDMVLTITKDANASDTSIYVNGVSRNDGKQADWWIDSSRNLGGTASRGISDGWFYAILLYDREITASEVASNYANSIIRFNI